MKKLMLGLIFVMSVTFLSSAVLFAQVWHPVNQVTVGWDAANLATGYKIFIKSVDSTIEKEVGATAELSYTITFQDEGRYFLGVQSVREVDEEIFHSIIVWSDNPEVCANGESFGAIYYELPDATTGLQVK